MTVDILLLIYLSSKAAFKFCDRFCPLQYEAQDVKELRMIFDGQNEIHRLVRGLLVKLDEVIGRQERELSMLTLINQGTAGQGNQVLFLMSET